jgi:hypothetical protein
MAGIARLTYWLGWVSLVVALVSRVLLNTSVREHMVNMNVLPRNFVQLTLIFFVASIASYTASRSSQA